jgi:hypothetical protein
LRKWMGKGMMMMMMAIARDGVIRMGEGGNRV